MPLHSLHDDLPTLDDKLDWSGELDRFSRRIENCPTPHVLGIHGNWGSGKTSFMRQLQLRLGGEVNWDGSVNKSAAYVKPKPNKKVAAIWFDAWRYQHESTPIVALLHEMRRQMSLMPTIKEKFKKLGEIALRYTLNSLDEVGKVIGFEGLPSSDKIQKLGDDWEKQHFAQSLSSDSIREHLHQTIISLLPSENSRVVVFIDDLDRCNPKAAMKLLEGLKIYLNLPNCVFVLGMNESILIDAIRDEISAPKEASPEEMNLRASHYLEKICTDIYRLPLPKNSVEFFSSWLPINNQVATLKLVMAGTACLPPNPRRLKALANQWVRFSGCVAFPKDPMAQAGWAARVLVAAYIHQFHRDLWERWHFNPDFWAEFLAWCDGTKSRNADGLPNLLPKWATALRLTARISSLGDGHTATTWVSEFPNPGDIDIFWMDGLIRKYRDEFTPRDFEPLLNGLQYRTGKNN
jgi:molybdopterin-guanine dinucleotide biosynthesis protein